MKKKQLKGALMEIEIDFIHSIDLMAVDNVLKQISEKLNRIKSS